MRKELITPVRLEENFSDRVELLTILGSEKNANRLAICTYHSTSFHIPHSKANGFPLELCAPLDPRVR